MAEDKGTDFLPLKECIKMYWRRYKEHKLFKSKPEYEPPYDSPIEDIFARSLGRYVNPNLRLDKQIEVNTPWGVFILDFVIECKSKRIAFECDGKDFHNSTRDEWRDAMILGEGHVDTIYRLRGTDLIHHTDDCLFVISTLEPQIFSRRGKVNLEVLASTVIKEDLYFKMSLDKNSSEGSRLMPLGFPPFFIYLVRESRHIPEGETALWKSHYSYALKNRGLALDNLIGKYLKEVDSRIIEAELGS